MQFELRQFDEVFKMAASHVLKMDAKMAAGDFILINYSLLLGQEGETEHLPSEKG